jgi:uncharacterized protein
MKPDQPRSEKKEDNSTTRLYTAFALLALFSCLGLDYIASRKGERSYVFPAAAPKIEVSEAPVSLTQMILRFLGESGLPADAIQEGEKEPGIPQVKVRLPRDAYTVLESTLESTLKGNGISFQKKEIEEEATISFSWVLRGKGRERIVLLFACPRPLLPKKEEVPPLPGENKVAIIIDDMGNSLEAIQDICALKEPVTISILPLSTYALETAQIAHENGLEVMLHLPGESLNHQEGIDEANGFIRSGMGEEEIKRIIEESLLKVPYVEGVNNHMGSKITQEETVMGAILKLMKEKDLYFLDSRTTADSIAYDLARKMGLRSAYRNVFLDSPTGVNFTKQKIIDLCRFSQRSGRAIGIGHPFPETLEALKENLSLLQKYRVKPVFVSQVVER